MAEAAPTRRRARRRAPSRCGTRCAGSSSGRCSRSSPSGSGATTTRATSCRPWPRSGVLGMSIPEEHGGSAIDLVGYALVFEELARGWMGLASVVGSSQSGCWLLGRFGTDDQRQRFLPDLAAGRRMSGIALTEPATGSDLKAITLRAERRGDALRRQRHEDDDHPGPPRRSAGRPGRDGPDRRRRPHRGMSLLLVEQGTPGWTVGRDITKLGHKGVELCELAFDDAVVPAANLLGGTEGSGLSQMLAALDRGRIYMAAASVGIARAALEAATRYATEREAFGSADRRAPGHQAEAGRHGHPRPGGPAADPRRRAPASTARAAPAATPPWPRCSPPRRPSSARWRRCGCSAATGTRRTSRSSASTATRRSWPSARGPTRSCSCSSPTSCWPRREPRS